MLIADSLDPEDGPPRVEVGITMMNSGRKEEARNHLEDMARDRETCRTTSESRDSGVATMREHSSVWTGHSGSVATTAPAWMRPPGAHLNWGKAGECRGW